LTEQLNEIQKFKYKIAIPAPSFVSQFSRRYKIERVLSGFLFMGFDEVMEVGLGADLLSVAITEYLNSLGALLPRPVISSACPAVVRLIQVKYPGLVGNIMPMQSPMEITARYVRRKAAEQTGLDPSEIGVFFITPCPAKATVIKQPIGMDYSNVTGVIATRDMVNFVKLNFERFEEKSNIQRASGVGIGWGRREGEIEAVDIPYRLSVDGIHHVSRMLEKIEEGGFRNIHFMEAQACVGGCVGGVLMVENPFVAKLKLHLVSKEIGNRNREIFKKIQSEIPKDDYHLSSKILSRPITSLSPDMREAMRKLQEIESLASELPGIDCGSCGCPTCQAFAEDVVDGLMMRMDCLFDLRQRVHNLAQEIYALAGKLPHVMQNKEAPDKTG
jgi:iron only hydrogenase large subunit-like protein